MSLELVRLGCLEDDHWFFTVLVRAGALWETCIDIVEPLLPPSGRKSIYILGRVPFHQEDAFILGVHIGDIL
jgi:hypothetical protein